MSNSIKEFRKFEYNAWQKSVAQYDNSFASLTNQMIKPLLNTVNAQTGVKILDIATGPGYVAADAAKRECQVIGLDFSDDGTKIAIGESSGYDLPYQGRTTIFELNNELNIDNFNFSTPLTSSFTSNKRFEFEPYVKCVEISSNNSSNK